MRLLLGLLLASLIGLLAPSPPLASAAGQQVMIMNFAYSTAALTVRVGDTITWTNHDDVPHDVVTSGGPAAFRSPLLDKGQSWTNRVTAAGTYSYYCSVHPDMRAQVVVLAADPLAPPPQRVTPTSAAVRPPAATTTTTVPPTTSSVPAVPVAPVQAQPAQAAAAPAVVRERLDPMLLVAGIVAAVAVLCLLLLGTRPDT